MPRRQPTLSLPRLWLFTDERVAEDSVLRAIAGLPRGSGIVFRHYGLERAARRALFRQVAALARRYGLMLLVAGEPVGRGADGVHKAAHGSTRRRPASQPGHILSASAHTAREIALARQRGADLIFLSPVFATRSHPGGRPLGTVRFAALARMAHCPVITLGGMNARRFRRCQPLGAYGWAAIDALTA